MQKISENIAVFYNKDCQKYGIKQHCKCHAYGDHWPQVVAPNGQAYTKYKAVAIRWAYDYIKLHGDKLMNNR